VFGPGYDGWGLESVAFLCSTGGTKGFGAPGLKAVLAVPGGEDGEGLGRAFVGVGADRGPDGARLGALVPPPATAMPPVTPPVALVALRVAIPTVLCARCPPSVVAVFAALGDFLAPRGAELVALCPLVASLLDAGRELDRLIAGLRAVLGRALGEGW